MRLRNLIAPAFLLALIFLASDAFGQAPERFDPGDAAESGAFNFGEAEAVTAIVDDGDRKVIQIDYTVSGDGGAGVWTKGYPAGLSEASVDTISVGVRALSGAAPIVAKVELKGAKGIIEIPLSVAESWNRSTTAIDWGRIGELNEAVVVITHPGGSEPATGAIQVDFEFYQLPFQKRIAAKPLGRSVVITLFALVAAALCGLLLKTLPASRAEPKAAKGLRRDLSFGIATVLITGIALTIGSLHRPPAIDLMGLCIGIAIAGAIVGEVLKFGLTGRHLSAAEVFLNLFVTGILAACASSLPILNAPQSSTEILSLCSFTAAVFAALYHVSNAWLIASKQRHISLIGGGVVLATPFVFSVLLMLGANDSGGFLRAVLIVFFFNEAVANGIALAARRSLVKGLRAHLLLLVIAIGVIVAPQIAALGSGEAVASWHSLPQFLATILTTIFSQAGLWVEAYILTGMLMDGIHGKAPNLKTLGAHARSGLGKGMVYSGVFMAIMHGLNFLIGSSGGEWLFANLPWLMAAGFGALAFPLIKTIIESFDGSTRFFDRVRNSYRDPWLYLRGAVVGAGAAWAITSGIFAEETGRRSMLGFAIGVAAFAGVSLLRDAINQGRKRGRVRVWRAYFVDALMGGFIGAALGFYLDAAQVAVVVAKFQQYVSFGQAATTYETIPFLNRWGFLNLGEWTGGVSLLFREALAGVINWSIAAWLFAINRTFLSAALDRTTSPIKFLFTREGFVQLIQHMIEVMRWGLWMSPIIFSFLRMMGEPTWYNQDGAVRTLFAAFNNLTMSPGGFAEWSLNVFVALLAYDLVRILIWIDHMGLRVATLVNFSFLGMDKLDGWVSRFIGRDATARYIPEGVKRFTTWAPLLIPFYIPMGGDWDYAWNKSGEIRAQASGGILGWLQSLPPIGLLLVTVAAIPLCTGVFTGLRAISTRRKKKRGSGHLTLSNRDYEIILKQSGECYSTLPQKGYDLTRRAYDQRDPAGRALFIVDETTDQAWPVMGNYPGEVSARPAIEESASGLRITSTAHEVRTTITITLPDDEAAVELWDVRIENLSNERRALKVVPYLEWVINQPGGDRGHTQYNRLFPEISYESGSNALLALHRYTKLHGILASEKAPAGFLTSRMDFIGRAQSLWSPRALQTLNFLHPQDSEAFPTFDPISSLLVDLDVEAGGSAENRFLIGSSKKRKQATQLIDQFLKPQTATVVRDEAQAHRSPLIGHGEILPGTPQPYFEYRDGGDTLRVLTPFTPRPWDHSMSNALGHVLCVTNRGFHTTSSGNSQQNRVTPDWADTVTRENPGEAFFLYDIDREKWFSPTWQSLNDADATYITDFSVDGTATFHMEHESLSTELTVFVPHDEPVGLYRLTVRNPDSSPRRLRLAPYFQIVLADMPENAGSLKTRHDEVDDALYFENPRNTFRQGVAFAAMTNNAAIERVETQRGHFFGEGNEISVAHPAMVKNGTPASDESDSASIAAFLTTLEVPANGEISVAVMLGQADDHHRAEAVVQKFRSLDAVDAALTDNRTWWRQLMATSDIETSCTEFDQMQNWLKYQAIAERIWARRGFYQASGAFGFRDQLQDSVSMIWVDPALARKQIQLHAAQQFIEGDTVHWFSLLQDGRTGFACRSHAYDNLLWLGWSVAEYVQMTGDHSLLNEVAPYLQAEQPLVPLPEGKHGMGFFAHRSPVQESVYHHCLRAFDLVFEHRLGPNGLPLIGAGDWNDGLDEIGSEGRGESTWLGFFLCYTLRTFLEIIEQREGPERRAHYQAKRDALVEALEKTWRDDRYLRAIHDDGTEIGIKGSGIWEIDALTAAWSVMSGINPQRSRICFDTAVQELEEEKVVRLGTPALRADSKPYLGRSSQYPEGVRENGMYCHGDQWLVKASRVLVEQCIAESDAAAAATYRETGLRIWRKISPLFHVTAEEIETYGGQPNKQAADILTTFDPGRMIWNGYTGAAGWMHRQAMEGILGMRLVDNELVTPEDIEEPRGDLKVTSASRDVSASPLPALGSHTSKQQA